MIPVSDSSFVFKSHGDLDWSRSHAQVPFALPMQDRLRIFFSTRDDHSRSAVGFVDVDLLDNTRIIRVKETPCLAHGHLGMFDESGTMPSWFVRDGSRILMYYTGWNRNDTSGYRLAIGLAESFDDGETFHRLFSGPILDRNKFDSVWVGQPCIMRMAADDWRMWYLSCIKMEHIDGKPEPFYCVKYATSKCGIDWQLTDKVCISFDANTDAIGRPCVWFEGNRFWMVHSNRSAYGYRTNPKTSYRLVLSVSDDGINWESAIDPVLSKPLIGWDSIMNEYASVIPLETSGQYRMFYNGNGFGESGFGYVDLNINSI